MNYSESRSYLSRGGIQITHTEREENYQHAAEPLRLALDTQRGVLLTSSFEYPGRYTRWDIGFVNPPLELASRGHDITISALNARGKILLPLLTPALTEAAELETLTSTDSRLELRVRKSDQVFAEEQRSRQPTVFTALRRVIDCLFDPDQHHLGLYGAFGYELAFQFEPTRLNLQRDPTDRDLLLYLPDEVLVVDHRQQKAISHLYDFAGRACGRQLDTEGLERDGQTKALPPAANIKSHCDHAPGEYAATVSKAIDAFGRGDLFEVVPGQTFFEPCPAAPSELFRRLKQRNPAPYGALINLGDGEFLVAASPEMYVRVEGRRIETCPISGTIRRGVNAIGDAKNILELLNSEKETSELTMCTDVDRNDKSRVCEAGSIEVIGRRQIEMYSRLIHTVDHVQGTLREGFDALDGFLAHTWAVTVTGAPKQHAIQFIEDHEHSPRRWYGGALGFIGFDGNMNTGLTLRTVRIKEGVAEVRAGATLLFESDPDAEERETRLKASALLDAIRHDDARIAANGTANSDQPGKGKRVLMVDHEDSFVHTLAGYFRETGAEVITYRPESARQYLKSLDLDLVLLSPGPGRPQDFNLEQTIRETLDQGLPLFGVCLGLQGIVEYFAGSLDVLPQPMHGKPSRIQVTDGQLFEGLPAEFEAGRYHSLFARRDALRSPLRITAETTDGLVMAVEHEQLPIAAVQFHPESILSLEGDCGIGLIRNVMRLLAAPAAG